MFTDILYKCIYLINVINKYWLKVGKQLQLFIFFFIIVKQVEISYSTFIRYNLFKSSKKLIKL